MNIDETVKELKIEFVGDSTNQREAKDLAIDIMRKYQKIEDIYYHQSGEALENSLRVVIEDGKID